MESKCVPTLLLRKKIFYVRTGANGNFCFFDNDLGKC